MDGIDEFEEDDYQDVDFQEVNSGRGTKVSVPSIRPINGNNGNDEKAKMSKPVPEDNER